MRDVNSRQIQTSGVTSVQSGAILQTERTQGADMRDHWELYVMVVAIMITVVIVFVLGVR